LAGSSLGREQHAGPDLDRMVERDQAADDRPLVQGETGAVAERPSLPPMAVGSPVAERRLGNTISCRRRAPGSDPLCHGDVAARRGKGQFAKPLDPTPQPA